MFEKIVTASDFSDDSRAAMFAAISVAARCLARIEMVHVISYLEDIYDASRFVVPDAGWQKELVKRLEEFFPKHLYPNSERHVLVGSSVAQEILKFAKTEHCGLIVTGRHGRNALAEFLMGSVAQQIARHSEIPVMIVRDEKSGRQYQGFNRVLVPTDFSPISRKAVEFGSRFASFLGAEFHLIHVVDEPEIKEILSSYPQYGLNMPSSCEPNLDEILKKMIPKDLTTKSTVATIIGDPTQGVLNYSEEHSADFIVMGAHGKKGLQRVLLGSLTTAVIAKSRVPVITLSQ